MENKYEVVEPIKRNFSFEDILKQTAVACGLMTVNGYFDTNYAPQIISGLAKVVREYQEKMPLNRLRIISASNKQEGLASRNTLCIRFGKKLATLQNAEYVQKTKKDGILNKSDYYNFDFDILYINQIICKNSMLTEIPLLEKKKINFYNYNSYREPCYMFEPISDFSELLIRIGSTTSYIFPFEILGIFDFWSGRKVEDDCGNIKKVLETNPIASFVLSVLSQVTETTLFDVIFLAKPQILAMLGIAEDITEHDRLIAIQAKQSLLIIKNKGKTATIG